MWALFAFFVAIWLLLRGTLTWRRWRSALFAGVAWLVVWYAPIPISAVVAMNLLVLWMLRPDRLRRASRRRRIRRENREARDMTSPAAPPRAVLRLGYWSAILTAVFCAVFTVAAVLTEARLLSAPWDVILPIAPSLFLAPSFLVLLVCVNAVTSSERTIWSQLGVAFGCVYVPLCVAAYIVELFVVEPRVLRGATDETALLTLVRGDSVFNAIDGIGYVFMCMATLFAAPAFGSTRLERWIRWLFLANGVLAIPIFLTYFVNRSFMWVAALWSVTTTGSALLLVMFFRSASRQPATAPAK